MGTFFIWDPPIVLFDLATQGLRKSVFGMLGMSILNRLDSGHMCYIVTYLFNEAYKLMS